LITIMRSPLQHLVNKRAIALALNYSCSSKFDDHHAIASLLTLSTKERSHLLPTTPVQASLMTIMRSHLSHLVKKRAIAPFQS
ncbi:MAG: hypothetical protein V7K94_11750, partial [Nostoc sp.]|uniref:hypothetical protein n=1 Tax=Nostoc sp. TaxID=1180 RepID=UPI002FFA2136